MPLSKRVFHIKCKGDQCIELAEIISQRLSIHGTIDTSITDSELLLQIHGYKTDIRKAWQTIRQLLGGQTSVGSRIKTYSIEQLVKNLHTTFPPQLLVEILRRKGYMAEYNSDESTINTEADYSETSLIIERISEIAKNLPPNLKGKSTKYFVIAASILTGKPPENIVGEAREKGIIVSEDNVLRVKYEWRQALDLLLEKKESP